MPRHGPLRITWSCVAMHPWVRRVYVWLVTAHTAGITHVTRHCWDSGPSEYIRSVRPSMHLWVWCGPAGTCVAITPARFAGRPYPSPSGPTREKGCASSDANSACSSSDRMLSCHGLRQLPQVSARATPRARGGIWYPAVPPEMDGARAGVRRVREQASEEAAHQRHRRSARAALRPGAGRRAAA